MMLRVSNTQGTEAPTKGLTPNLAFPLEVLPRQPGNPVPYRFEYIYPRIYKNTYQSDTSKLNADDRTANGQAVKCINGGATTVSVKFDLTLTIPASAENIHPYASNLTLELGSINGEVYTLIQAYTGDKLKSRTVNPGSNPRFGPPFDPLPFVLKDLEIIGKATQNLVIRLTETRIYFNNYDITNSITTISLSNFNATFPQALLA